MKHFQQKVCIFCAETVKTGAAASEHIFYVSANVWLLLGVFQCFLRNRRLLLNVQLILCVCVAASRNLLMFFNKHKAASDRNYVRLRNILK